MTRGQKMITSQDKKLRDASSQNLHASPLGIPQICKDSPKQAALIVASMQDADGGPVSLEVDQISLLAQASALRRQPASAVWGFIAS